MIAATPEPALSQGSWAVAAPAMKEKSLGDSLTVKSCLETRRLKPSSGAFLIPQDYRNVEEKPTSSPARTSSQLQLLLGQDYRIRTFTWLSTDKHHKFTNPRELEQTGLSHHFVFPSKLKCFSPNLGPHPS